MHDTKSIVSTEQGVRVTAFLIPNLHCPTCVTTIANSLASLRPAPSTVDSSIVSHIVTVTHDEALSSSAIKEALEDAGFEVFSFAEDGDVTSVANPNLEKHSGHGLKRWSSSNSKDAELLREKHIASCAQCQAERVSTATEATTTESSEEEKADERTSATLLGTKQVNSQEPEVLPPDLFETSFAIEGMTCSSCVRTISDAIHQYGWVRSVDVNLLSNSASVVFEGKENLPKIIEAIDDAGYGATVQSTRSVNGAISKDMWRATYVIGGMTCSSCVVSITNAVQQLDCVAMVNVNLVSNSAVVTFEGKEHLSLIKEAIVNAGYDATLDDLASSAQIRERDPRRKVSVRVDGMYCVHCPRRIQDALKLEFGDRLDIERLPTTSNPILRMSYVPDTPNFTIRNIMATIAATDTAFVPSIFHPPSLEEKSRQMRTLEMRRLLFRLLLSFVVAIPTFVIGIVLMSLVSSSNNSRRFLEEPIWAGNVSRGEWAMFILATPVYFFAADIFHVRALKEIWVMWRPKSTFPFLRRFYRFGSMNMLISMATTIAYFSSIAELAIAATHSVDNSNASYFDSVVFLTMFLLIGRSLEAYSKAKTGDAVTSLAKLRPIEALLVEADGSSRKVSVDELESGDVVKVLNGGSPPSDGIIIDGSSEFDESSLTGESKLIEKHAGDEVFAGTVNKATPVSVRVSSISGTSMLDQIVKVVREGQAKRAPIERVADVITSYFVPSVVVIGVLTWLIWLSLGVSGSLPAGYRDTQVGGWLLWSLQFSIAVFVIACPCGIGLAAPTALFVGGGLAAQHGLLVKGGGEAFQEASGLNCVVFDKTGTLTKGGEPTVTEYQQLSEDQALGIVKSLEESTSHPIAKALVSFCESKGADQTRLNNIVEVPGKGMKGVLATDSAEVILGNEALMSDFGVDIEPTVHTTLEVWKNQGKSVVMFASKPDPTTGNLAWTLRSIFAVSDPVRPESAFVISKLKERGIDVWMISGDNPATAQAVGRVLGIPESNVIAGVLPDQKAKNIEWLRKQPTSKGHPRTIVAMVGDGINDAPALTEADVGIAVGSGSDVAISSADFVLMSSHLTTVLTLIDLSRTVFRRVYFNFGWALVYNMIALPIAAGVLYPVVSNGSHVRLDPVWASLAMALSSVSVVCSSLLLRSKLPGVGFRVLQSVAEEV
ncbi:DEKNAAC104839 [Brettanomyces naardenensis]|uniref:DEKNAAC104839 n=1 Tax=Brettanomyces naardenensis TaxID=13370 RepID=A0A448YS96_BRENA|nr:DEKNAAC104839 [Brettanomyces naardenensis]